MRQNHYYVRFVWDERFTQSKYVEICIKMIIRKKYLESCKAECGTRYEYKII